MAEIILTESEKATLLALADRIKGTGGAQAPTRLPRGSDLNAALRKLQDGESLELEPGVWEGGMVLPTGSARRQLLGVGVEVIPLRAQPALATEPMAHNWTLQGSWTFRGDPWVSDVIRLGDGGQTSLEAVPQNLVLRGIQVIGAPSGQRRGVALNSGATVIEDLTVRQIRQLGNGDTQAIGGWNGPGPFTLKRLDLEAAGENIMFGGEDPRIPGLVPTGITIEGLRSFKPLEWAAEGWATKNHFELKNARQVRVTNAVFENLWRPSQGYALNLKSVNQGGGEDGSHCVVEDVEFRDIRLVNCCGGLNTHLGPEQPALPTKGIRFFNADLRATSGWCVLLQGTEGLEFHNCTLDTTNNTALYVEELTQGFQMHNCILVDNAYGIKGPGFGEGNATIAGLLPGAILEGNIWVTASGRWYPGGSNLALAPGTTLPPGKGYGA